MQDKILRIIDKQTNFFIRDDFTFDEATEIGLDVEPSQGLYQPKWDGTQWIENLTADEISALLAKQTTSEPSLDNRLGAVESDVDEIVTVLATIEGVSV